MYENQTYEEILRRMLERIPRDIDKREGAVVFDSNAPAAAEIAPHVPSIQPIPSPSPSVIRNRVFSSNPVFSVNAHATDWAQLKPLSWNAIACFALSFPEIPDIRKSPF